MRERTSVYLEQTLYQNKSIIRDFTSLLPPSLNSVKTLGFKRISVEDLQLSSTVEVDSSLGSLCTSVDVSYKRKISLFDVRKF